MRDDYLGIPLAGCFSWLELFGEGLFFGGVGVDCVAFSYEPFYLVYCPALFLVVEV